MASSMSATQINAAGGSKKARAPTIVLTALPMKNVLSSTINSSEIRRQGLRAHRSSRGHAPPRLC